MSSILRSVFSKSRPALSSIVSTSQFTAVRTISTSPVTRLENLVPPETAYPESLRGQAFEPSGWRAASDRKIASFAKDEVLGDPDMERPDRAGTISFVNGIGREYL